MEGRVLTAGSRHLGDVNIYNTLLHALFYRTLEWRQEKGNGIWTWPRPDSKQGLRLVMQVKKNFVKSVTVYECEFVCVWRREKVMVEFLAHVNTSLHKTVQLKVRLDNTIKCQQKMFCHLFQSALCFGTCWLYLMSINLLNLTVKICTICIQCLCYSENTMINWYLWVPLCQAKKEFVR